MKLFQYIFSIYALLTFASCEKEIDFEYKDIPEQQVIEGLLTQEGVNVRLTKTVATDEPFTHKTIIDADVTVAVKTAGEIYSLTPNEDGVFTLSGLIGQTGHEYELTVSIGEDIYKSTSRMLTKSNIQ